MKAKCLRLKLWNYLGTEVHLTRSGISPYLFCMDCGARVRWAALIPKRKWWAHTACWSCEGYMHFMCRENPNATEEAA